MSATGWIPFYWDTLEKTEIQDIADTLDITHGEALEACLRLWVWADQQLVTLSSRTTVTALQLERISLTPGITNALQSVGWLSVTEKGVVFRGLSKKQNQPLKQRLLTARRQRKSRARGVTKMSRTTVTEALPEEEEESSSSIQKKKSGAILQLVLDTYNGLAAGKLPQAQGLTKKRATKLRTRLRSDQWRANWRGAFAKAAESAFCCGENDRGWKANFDWLIRDDDVCMRLMEGAYDGRPSRETAGDSAGQSGQGGQDSSEGEPERRFAEGEAVTLGDGAPE